MAYRAHFRNACQLVKAACTPVVHQQTQVLLRAGDGHANVCTFCKCRQALSLCMPGICCLLTCMLPFCCHGGNVQLSASLYGHVTSLSAVLHTATSSHHGPIMSRLGLDLQEQ